MRQHGADDVEYKSADRVAQFRDQEAAMAANPVRKLVSAIDLESWLAGLSEDDQVLLAMRMAGYKLKPIAKRLGISTSAAWARSRELGHELAERAHVEVPGGSRDRN